MAPRDRSAPQYIYDRGARILSVGFALLLAIPALGTPFADDAVRSRWENRELVAFPSLGVGGREVSYFKAMDAFLNDHFGLALPLNELHRRFLFYVFRDSPVPNITLGEDGFVFLNAHGSDEPFSALRDLCVDQAAGSIVGRAVASWQHVLTFYNARVPRVALLIPPTKPVLYPDKLPISVPRTIREACMRYRERVMPPRAVSERLSAGGAIVVYPLEEFLRARYKRNFYPRENFHFAGASAHALARQALTRMGIIPDKGYDRVVVKDTMTDDLSQLLGFRRAVRMPVYPYRKSSLTLRRQAPAEVLTYYAKARDFGTFTAKASLSGRTALIVSNSFGAFAAGHLAPGYRSITWVNINDLGEAEHAGFLGDFIRRESPDDLFFIFNDATVAHRGVALSRALTSLEDSWPAIARSRAER